ncbi:MAG: enoyl-CoA hydratase-related protein, partial [Alphaproteobacteria bacterium]|nr:enoyl-CoA hydratase-related protein [Alphaproteobacteria bacterium]
MTTDLLESVQDRVATLTMNRPDRRNAMSGDMLEALLESLARIGADGDVGAVILTGAGGAFCAGGDVKAMAEGKEFAEEGLEAKARGLRRVMEV